eukprot:CAMPEP_0197465030 /NCGR_PEP_ID=MMETSP1175-20131217/64329_1 /TAXON_ID=1003142 /ORGANISM="Triceratium dubium, Strain CCMP147" /LENGTH=518 /DNA_ID=CAMNT_0043001035 /DNA_START=260 /DNA_END=1816 /DNA_ORIENTATION=-
MSATATSAPFPTSGPAFGAMALGNKRNRRLRSVSGGGVVGPEGTTIPAATSRGPNKKKAAAKPKKKESCDPNKPENQTIPIFLKKTYKMIDTCDPMIASWTPDGEMFVVKDPDLFATTIIPQYFDHNKFSSFARQLNFYGFRKMQAKPIRNADFDAGTAKHVTFYNEKFKRGRCDLLREIQRSTRGGTASVNADHQKEVEALKARVAQLEQQVQDINDHFEEKMRTMELGMLGRMEQMLIAINHSQQQQQSSSQAPKPSAATSSDQVPSATNNMSNSMLSMNGAQQNPGRQISAGVQWDPLPYARSRENSGNNVTGVPSMGAGMGQNHQMPPPAPVNNVQSQGTPTLPPHPKQKQLKLPDNLKPTAANPMRGPSVSEGLLRGLSTESAGLPPWEREFFRQLMIDNSRTASTSIGAALGGTSLGSVNESEPLASGPISDQAIESAIAAAAGAAGVPQLSKMGAMQQSSMASNGNMGNGRQTMGQTLGTMPLSPADLSPSQSNNSLSSGEGQQQQQQHLH